jgi:FixJ family two-component response regulator
MIMPDIPRRPDGLLRPLTRRQLDVARLVAAGLGTTEVSEQLHISYDVAKMHIVAIASLLPNPYLLQPLRLVRQWASQHRESLWQMTPTNGSTNGTPP